MAKKGYHSLYKKSKSSSSGSSGKKKTVTRPKKKRDPRRATSKSDKWFDEPKSPVEKSYDKNPKLKKKKGMRIVFDKPSMKVQYVREDATRETLPLSSTGHKMHKHTTKAKGGSSAKADKTRVKTRDRKKK